MSRGQNRNDALPVRELKIRDETEPLEFICAESKILQGLVNAVLRSTPLRTNSILTCNRGYYLRQSIFQVHNLFGSMSVAQKGDSVGLVYKDTQLSYRHRSSPEMALFQPFESAFSI